jgi:hypothetical protein
MSEFGVVHKCICEGSRLSAYLGEGSARLNKSSEKSKKKKKKKRSCLVSMKPSFLLNLTKMFL